MDTNTGEIREFDSRDSLQKAVATGEWEQLRKRPDKNCKTCYGRGYIGYDLVSRKYVVCRCVKLIPDPLQSSDIPLKALQDKVEGYAQNNNASKVQK